MDIATEIARASLTSGAISINLEKPFTGVSGIKIDNRMLLGSREHRMLVAKGLAEIIKSIPCDMIAGTSLSGIAPAATVAKLLQKPLIILYDNLAYHPPQSDLVPASADVIASTTPWAIPSSVLLANDLNLPYVYVRPSRKEHGMEKQIEGRFAQGQRALLIDMHDGKSYGQHAQEVLRREGLAIGGCDTQWFQKRLANVNGKRIVVIEDLINTGLSLGNEIMRYRKLGATVENCIATYTILKMTESFYGTKAHCLVPYETLFDQAESMNYFDSDTLGRLREWSKSPITWNG